MISTTMCSIWGMLGAGGRWGTGAVRTAKSRGPARPAAPRPAGAAARAPRRRRRARSSVRRVNGWLLGHGRCTSDGGPSSRRIKQSTSAGVVADVQPVQVTCPAMIPEMVADPPRRLLSRDAASGCRWRSRSAAWWLIVLGHGRRTTHTARLTRWMAAAGVALLLVALIVWMINWLFRMSVESNQERSRRRRRASTSSARALARRGPVTARACASSTAVAMPPEECPIMGVVNVTPDSFSDGGRYPRPRAAIAHGLELEAQGAEILDIGGESRGPGAEPVGAEEERGRVLPVIEGLDRARRRAPDLDRHLQGGGRRRGARTPARRSSTTSPRWGDPRWPRWCRRPGPAAA